jgi:hypothetical protein
MGVQIYLLDRRKVTLLVDDLVQEIGTLRRSWKVTEIDGERAMEIDPAKAGLQGKTAPVAVMVADVAELPLVAEPSKPVAAHLVLGWDADRSSVTDFEWDYLPILGYAVQTSASVGYILHEERAGGLSPVTRIRAVELGIHDQAGQFLRQGQPSIAECRSVRPYTTSYAQADCILSNGQAAEILTSIEAGETPEPAWYTGKRPADVARYPTQGQDSSAS